MWRGALPGHLWVAIPPSVSRGKGFIGLLTSMKKANNSDEIREMLDLGAVPFPLCTLVKFGGRHEVGVKIQDRVILGQEHHKDGDAKSLSWKYWDE